MILSSFQKQLTQEYFLNILRLPKTKYEIDGKTYFMGTLLNYLQEHQCDSVFIGNNMHEKRIEYKEYGTWGKKLYDATYIITDFSVILHKLYYITYIFCKNSKIFNPNGNLFYNEHAIENIIDSGQISISQM